MEYVILILIVVALYYYARNKFNTEKRLKRHYEEALKGTNKKAALDALLYSILIIIVELIAVYFLWFHEQMQAIIYLFSVLVVVGLVLMLISENRSKKTKDLVWGFLIGSIIAAFLAASANWIIH